MDRIATGMVLFFSISFLMLSGCLKTPIPDPNSPGVPHDPVSQAMYVCGAGFGSDVSAKLQATYEKNVKRGDIGLAATKKAAVAVLYLVEGEQKLEAYKTYIHCIERSGVFAPGTDLDCSDGCIVSPVANARVSNKFEAKGIAPLNIGETETLRVAIRIRGNYWPKETILLDNRTQWDAVIEENANSYDLVLFLVKAEGKRIIEEWEENSDYSGLDMSGSSFLQLDRVSVSKLN